MRLNLGCGYRRIEGCWNIDCAPEVEPDQVVDLEKFPWPWETDSIDEMQAVHSLEHLGQDQDVFLRLMQEAWRVLRPGATWCIVFPDVRSDGWFGDTTHVRPLTPASLSQFSQARNREAIACGWPNTTSGMRLGIDFAVDQVKAGLTPEWDHLTRADQATVDRMIRTHCNVVNEWEVVLRAVKPAGSEAG